MPEVISIPTTTTSDKVVYYHIEIKIPLRSYTVQRRYSEFEQLVNNLAKDLGINILDLPYQLPLKRWFASANVVINERMLELTKLLNILVQNSEFQNNPILHKFLQVPLNFKFTKQMFGSSDDIDNSTWLSIHRSIKSKLSDSSPPSRQVINQSIKPSLINLKSSLIEAESELTVTEFNRRKVLLKELEDKVESLQSVKSEATLPGSFPSLTKSKRVFGAAQETKDTVDKSNQELLQQQIQIHQEQDSEVENLRQLIARQRELGELIHNEVEDQNNMLDGFQNELESTEIKLNIARQKAKKLN